MFVTLIISVVAFSFAFVWLAFKGLKNVKENIFAFVAALVSIVIVIICSIGINSKIEKALPAPDEIPTGNINITELALDSNWKPNKEIARFALENEKADFVTVDKEKSTYLVTLYCINGEEELFVLNKWDMYHLLPYVEFIHQPNVE